MRYLYLLNYFLLLLGILFLGEQVTKSKPALAGESCKIKPLKDWSPQEKWVWKQACEGKVANFNEAVGYGGELDPRKSEDWQKDQLKNRILRSSFLETILLDESYRGALHRKGVRIIGAWFPDSVDLSDSRLDHPLLLDKCRFDKDVDLWGLNSISYISLEGSKFNGKLNMGSIDVKSSLYMRVEAEFEEVFLHGAKIGGQIDMTGSKFNGRLIMNAIEVQEGLFMRKVAEFKEVDLIGAKIGGQLSMNGSKFKDKLNMDSIEVQGNLLMRCKAEFKEVVLRDANIGGQIDMTGSKFKGKLNMSGVDVKSLFMRDGDIKRDGYESEAEFEEVVLIGAKIGGQLSMIGSKFNGRLSMDSIEVKKHLFMTGVTTPFPVNLGYAVIGGSLYLWGSNLNSLDLTGTHIGQELNLGSEPILLVEWNPESKLTLRNTVVGALVDHPDAWPKDLELDGFTYARLGGFGGDSNYDMDSRDVSDLIQWIKKDKSYSPQPYKQLASVLAEEGHKGKARDILYHGKNRELSEAEWTDKPWLFLNFIFIGYGYRMYYAAFWAVGLIVLGMSIIYKTKSGPLMRPGVGFRDRLFNHFDIFFYSLDMLLPIIKLNEGHKDIPLPDGVRYYFYIHHMMGYVLGFFLIAGLSGLIAK